jgi:crossover junction endodeoxyribonuclease RuvC
MKIISIDPGFDRLGIAIIEKINTGERLVFSECFTTDKKNDNHERLFSISVYIEKIIIEYKPDILIIENIFLFKNQKTIIDVAGARAIIINECKKYKIKIFELTPMQIKSAIAGHGHAGKDQVEFMVMAILKQDKYLQNKIQNNLIKNKKKLLDDEIDAIACGLAGIAYFKNYF